MLIVLESIDSIFVGSTAILRLDQSLLNDGDRVIDVDLVVELLGFDQVVQSIGPSLYFFQSFS